MNYTKLFYWLCVADNAKTMFIAFIVIFTAISLASTIWFLVDRGLDDWKPNIRTEKAKKWIWWSYPFMILFWSLWVFTPTKKDALLIVAGGQTMNFLSTDASAKKIPSELSSFVLTELKNMALEAKVDLGIQSQKEKIIESAKSMTTNELLQKIQLDTSFAKIILQK